MMRQGKSKFAIQYPDGLTIRTPNFREAIAITHLTNQGYLVIRRGWPDLAAWKDGKLRLIEVKDGGGKLKRHQFQMAEWLASFGIEVEIWPQGEEHMARNWRRDKREQ